MNRLPTVVVQILVHGEPFSEIDMLMRSLERTRYPKESWKLVIVNNVKHGNDLAWHINSVWLKRSGITLPEIIFTEQRPNLGFAGGHMRAYQLSIGFNPKYVYLLNADAEVSPGFLEESVLFMEEHIKAAVAQSSVHLLPETNRLNSRGNAMHFLGFGYSLGYRELANEARDQNDTLPMFYASGAAVIVRAEAVQKIGGLFDPNYFLYHEDTDLSWRARLAGYDVLYADKSVVFHRYEFSKSIQKFYWMERNRHLTNLTCYKWRTILLLLPATIVMELGTMLFALRSGWGREKLKSWIFFLRIETWRWIWRRRRWIASVRIVDDSALLQKMVGVIVNQEVNNPLLTRIVNPLLSIYFRFLKLIVRW